MKIYTNLMNFYKLLFLSLAEINKKNIPDLLCITIIGIFCLVVAVITPPFQSPDEINHFYKSYAVSQGNLGPNKQGIVLVDSNIRKFASIYTDLAFHYENKFSTDKKMQSKNLEWSDNDIEESAPNVAVYSPVFYFPQALGINIGRLNNSSIYSSYQISKICSILICILILLLSALISPIPPLAWAFIGMPMTLFQMSSTSPDGLIFASSVLVGALIAKVLRQAKEDSSSLNYEFLILTVLMVFIATVKMNMLPLFILLFLIGLKQKVKYNVLIVISGVVLSLAWIALAYKDVMLLIHFGLDKQLSTTDKLIYFWNNKSNFFEFFINTFTNFSEIKSQFREYIGVLGWLDTPLTKQNYCLLAAGIALISIMTFMVRNVYNNVLSLYAIISTVLLTYFILLITWTDLSSNIIQGVQGRYFIPLFIIIAFLSFNHPNKRYWRISGSLSILFLIYSGLITVNALIGRYYLN